MNDEANGIRNSVGLNVISGAFLRDKSKGIVFANVDDYQRCAEPAPPIRRPAKVARMLSLAQHLQNALELGVARNRAVVARRLGIAESRLSQALNLLCLAPDIQLQVLEMEEAVDGVEPTTEKALRRIAKSVAWGEQREIWVGTARSPRHSDNPFRRDGTHRERLRGSKMIVGWSGNGRWGAQFGNDASASSRAP